jgi:hypothetical protein
VSLHNIGWLIGLHGVRSQKRKLSITTTVRTSNPTFLLLSSEVQASQLPFQAGSESLNTPHWCTQGSVVMIVIDCKWIYSAQGNKRTGVSYYWMQRLVRLLFPVGKKEHHTRSILWVHPMWGLHQTGKRQVRNVSYISEISVGSHQILTLLFFIWSKNMCLIDTWCVCLLHIRGPETLVRFWWSFVWELPNVEQ